MATQLHLLDDREPSWRIDERTCELGRRGIAAAREVLRQARPSPGDEFPQSEAA